MAGIYSKYSNSFHMNFLKLIFCALPLFVNSFGILLVYDYEDTASLSSLTEQIKTKIPLSDQVDISTCQYQEFELCITFHPSLQVIFDISDNFQAQYELDIFCKENSIVHIVKNSKIIYHSEWTFSISSSWEDTKSSFISLLHYFNWTEGVYFKDPEDTDITEELKKKSILINSLSVECLSPIEDFLAIEVMSLGKMIYFVFTNSHVSGEIQESLANAKLLGIGTAIIFVKESSYGASIDGALIMTENGQENSESDDDYLSTAFANLLSLITPNTTDSFQFRNTLLQKCPSDFCATEFSLINIHGGHKHLVGSIKKNEIIITSTIVFPGNSTIIPVSKKKVINLSISDGSTNPNSSPATSNPANVRGAHLAIEMVNEGNDILSNFEVSMFSYDCGVTVYNANFSIKCYSSNIDKIGYGHVAAYGSNVAVGDFQTFKALNITVPCVGAGPSDAALSSTANFPYYARVNLASSYLYNQIPLYLKASGWKKIAVIYQNDANFGKSAYYYINQSATNQGLEIVNDPNLRAIPMGLNRTQLKNYTNVIQAVINSGARLVIAAFAPPFAVYITEMFYDLGMRKGDIIFFAVYSGFVTDIAAKDDYTYKRLEVAVPMLRIYQELWVGEKGTQVYNRLVEKYKEAIAYNCPYYDTSYLIAYSINWMITKGDDYTDPAKLQKSIRSVKFLGCTGNVYIQPGSNDRIVNGLIIDSNSYNNDTGISVYTTALLKPFGPTILTIKQPLIYADGTTNKPSDLRITITDCPFPNKEIRTFVKGRAMVFAISFTIAGIMCISTFLIWKRWWNIKVEELKTKAEISIQDFLVGATIAIEFFQLISMGPDIRPMSTFIADIGDMLSLDLGSFFKLQNGVFWWVLDGVLAATLVWVILCIVILFQLDEKYSRIWIFRKLGWLGDNLMPILGNLCFIPFMSILLDVFVCDESIGDSFSDSFLNKDCYQFCWTGDHIIYSVLSFLAILSYEPLAVYCRPLWQELQNNLHVISIPLFLMVKTVVQILLIVLNKTLKRADEVVHGFLFVGLLILSIAFILKFKAYNYPRFTFWQILSLAGVAWIALLGTIFFISRDNNFPWIALIIGGLLFILIYGLIRQRKGYPSLLFRKKTRDTSTLFRFAFTFGKQTKIGSKVLPFSGNKSSSLRD
ncbi:unnamed protein product [Blepharisma stoltei]|uniref:Receptor ligand binding region domain-containing protein n=1 Tax=Blepharisma stoltei TaxID=1481888 RepID=A0AAU9JX74_9CILI|nr:unnamed protein product [Blepharisma stoltei]